MKILLAACFVCLYLLYALPVLAKDAEIPEALNGVWIEAPPRSESSFSYRITIRGDNILVTWREEVLCDTIFRLERDELKNTKKRANWQEYAKEHQYESIGHFSSLEYKDGALTGYIFAADLGYMPMPFIKAQDNTKP